MVHNVRQSMEPVLVLLAIRTKRAKSSVLAERMVKIVHSNVNVKMVRHAAMKPDNVSAPLDGRDTDAIDHAKKEPLVRTVHRNARAEMELVIQWMVRAHAAPVGGVKIVTWNVKMVSLDTIVHRNANANGITRTIVMLLTDGAIARTNIQVNIWFSLCALNILFAFVFSFITK